MVSSLKNQNLQTCAKMRVLFLLALRLVPSEIWVLKGIFYVIFFYSFLESFIIYTDMNSTLFA